MPTQARRAAAHPPRSTSASLAAIARASSDSGAIPTAAAASLTSRSTASLDRTPADGLLERRDVPLGDEVDVVLSARELARGLAHREPDIRPRPEQLERRHERGDLAVVDRHLQRHVVRQLREPADVADDQRLAERERTDRRARRLAHRRRAKVDVHVGGRHQLPQTLLRPRSPRASRPEPSRPRRWRRRSRSNPGDDRTDEQEPRPRAGAGRTRAKASSSWGTRLLAFTLPKLAKSGSPATSIAGQVGHGEGGMRDDPDRAAEAGRASAVVDVAGMDDQAGGEVEHLSREREVLGPVLPQRWNALLHHGVPEQPRGQPAVALEGVQVRLPVAAPERDARDEVMEHEVVEHDEPRRRCAAHRRPSRGHRGCSRCGKTERSDPRGAFFAPRRTVTISQRAWSAGSRSAE